MNDWDLMGEVINAANTGQQELSKLILDSNFTNRYAAQDAALNCFTCTPENVEKHKEAALKLAGLEGCVAWGLAASLRHSIINQISRAS